jgi:hypothetical protein
MSDQIKLLNNIFAELNKTGVLDELVLTGSWCQYVYKRSDEYRYVMQQASTITTMDIDFTIPDKNKVKTEADVPAILKGIGFTEEIKRNSLVKFENPDLELEFFNKTYRQRAVKYTSFR